MPNILFVVGIWVFLTPLVYPCHTVEDVTAIIIVPHHNECGTYLAFRYPMCSKCYSLQTNRVSNNFNYLLYSDLSSTQQQQQQQNKKHSPALRPSGRDKDRGNSVQNNTSTELTSHLKIFFKCFLWHDAICFWTRSPVWTHYSRSKQFVSQISILTNY